MTDIEILEARVAQLEKYLARVVEQQNANNQMLVEAISATIDVLNKFFVSLRTLFRALGGG